jgi:hypothetical protein
MGSALLLACLWGLVLVYWLWSRRPLGDPVGSFRHELRVLGNVTPARVAAANRLSAGATLFVSSAPKRLTNPAGPVQRPDRVAAAARNHTRQEMQRRRRDIIFVLAVAALLSLFAAVLTGSTVVILLQLLVDVVLVTYVYLLFTRAAGVQDRPNRPAARPRRDGPADPAVSTVRLARSNYVRASVFEPADWQEPSYGDFGSYASLAISQSH